MSETEEELVKKKRNKMFSFHKPKVYRSTIGCCICKAKSSSSRFTDSRKYENDFIECFQLSNQRYGEICNACVLLVKRFKRLPGGSKRHWGHVVDARAGPGIKCVKKHKKRIYSNFVNESSKIYNESVMDDNSSNELISEKDSDLLKCEMDVNSPGHSEESWVSDESNPMSDGECPRPLHKRKSFIPIKRDTMTDTIIILDSNFWQRKEVCCGVIWIDINDQVILDTQYFKPCKLHRLPSKTVPAMNLVTAPVKSFNDCSSDSGYESSASHLIQLKNSKDIPSLDPPKEEPKHEVNGIPKVGIIAKSVNQKRVIIIKKIIPDTKKSLGTIKPTPTNQV